MGIFSSLLFLSGSAVFTVNISMVSYGFSAGPKM